MKMNCLILFVFSIILYGRPNLAEAKPSYRDWYQDLSIVYDPDNESTEYDEMPKSCQEKGLTYCLEKGDKYPHDLIEKALKDIPSLEVITEPTNIMSYETLEKIDSRQGGNDGITAISADCPSESKNDLIYYIIDTKGNTRVVIQSPKLYQMYTLRQCINEGPIKRETKHFLSNSKTLEKYDIQCKTSKMEVDFIVLNDDDYDNLKLERVKVKDGIPICCKCVLL